MVEKVVLVAPRGFCAGVVNAIALVEDALARHGPPVYVRRAIVHNPRVVVSLAARGAVFVRELAEVPPGGVIVFSAHGVTRAVREEAAARGLRGVDATCPLVEKVHGEVRRFLARGYAVVLIGHAGHDEVVGTLGQAPGQIHLVTAAEQVAALPLAPDTPVGFVTQTTLSQEEVAPVVGALRARFANLAQPPVADICFATRNRQQAVRWLAERVDVVIVLGDTTSSNSRRLREVAAAAGRPAYLAGGVAEIDPAWLEGVRVVGLTAGASTPEAAVQEAAAYFTARGAELRETTLLTESTDFRRRRENGAVTALS